MEGYAGLFSFQKTLPIVIQLSHWLCYTPTKENTMADGPTGPGLEQMMALIRASQGQGGSGSAPILMGVRLDQNVGAPLSIQGQGLIKADGKAQFSAPRRDGLFAKLLKDMGISGGEIVEGMKKVAQAGPVREASITEITGQSSGLGSGSGMGQGSGGYYLS
jgi:hypothetical protein